MFNFIFDGKLGNIIAPVGNTSKLFLAIQHHKNVEFFDLISQQGYELNALLEGGQAAIHVACRYDNRVAVEAIISRTSSTDLPDANGNTPLHYASKYGNLEVCKFLIDRGAFAASLNNQRQSPYDVATSHVLRQYLLPLLMQAEKQNHDSSSQMYDPMAAYTSSGQQYQSYGGGLPTTTSSYPQPPMPYSQHMPTLSHPPGMNSSSSSGSTTPNVLDGGNLTYGSFPQYSIPSVQNTTPTTTRLIQPDGFHSSASDPILQAKYGHVKEVKAIAPPPIGLPGGQNPGNAPQYNMYNTTSHPYSSPSIYNRYVPYDAHTNGPASIPNVPPVNPQTIYPQGQYGQQSNVFIPGAPVPGPPPVMSAPANSAPLAAPLAPAPWASPPVAPLQGKSAFQRPVEQPPVGHSTSMNSLSSAGGRSDPFSAANRLLGNVAVAKDVVVDAPLQEPASAAQSTTLSASVLTTSSAPAVFPAEAPKSDDSPIIVFNPTTDSSVELSSTSSAVM